VTGGAESLVGHAALIQKIYFPRIIIPVSAVATCAVDFVIGLPLMAVAVWYYQQGVTSALLWLPLPMVSLSPPPPPLGFGSAL